MQDHDTGRSKDKPENEMNNQNSKDSLEDTKKSRASAQEGLDGDVLAWLEGPAFNAPIEEMPTLQWPERERDDNFDDIAPPELPRDKSTTENQDFKKQTGDPVDNLEDAMVWLEQMAAGQGTPIDEMPTLISGGQYDDLDSIEPQSIPQSAEITGKTSILNDHDSDPMAWLEQLAVDQSSPLEELPSVADRLLASEIISQNEIENYTNKPASESLPTAIEVEEALKYLEQLAREDGIDLNTVTIDQLKFEPKQENRFTDLDKLAVTTAVATTAVLNHEKDTKVAQEDNWDDLSAQIPDDPDEALAWLGGLADEDLYPDKLENQGEVQDAAAVVVEGPDVANKGQQDLALDDDTFDDMPDDPDKAMIWMQGLANENEDEVELIQTKDTAIVRTESEQQKPKERLSNLEVLAVAKRAIESNDLEKAAEYYQDVLDGGGGGQQVIDDLEFAVDKNPESPDLLRLLGDAYMQNGQMQKALETYRKGFAHL